ncbi:MAG: ElyC/SanA/YdcF family protein [Verrucomicrobiota bacterium JB023]|nr:ElyC/SanA/YdcF family protein [Verrucomicrobiota bacterium JB023]
MGSRLTRWWKLGWRWVLWLGMAFSFLGLSFVAYTYLAAERAGEALLYDDLAEVPAGSVGLVFGTSEMLSGGGPNPYFTNRMEAAAELWHAGKVRCFIVSGDNREKYYNEPNDMRDALIERGVPKGVIVRDFAGLRTLDSVVRAKEIFEAPDVVFISQRFQNERAAYLAWANDLTFVGYNADDVGAAGLRTSLREIPARVKMWLDVRVLKTRPRHLGEKESLPLDALLPSLERE